MNDRFIENDIKKALNEVPMEKMNKRMENVNPLDFKCPDDLTQKRIEKTVMKKMKEQKKKKTSMYKKAAYTAAALAVVTGSAFVFGDQVRAALDKVFAFVPNQGIVEMDVNSEDTTNTTGEKEKKDTVVNNQSIFVMKERTKASLTNCNFEMESASLLDNKLKVVYSLDMLKVGEVDNSEGYSVEAMISAFKESGMEKYGTYNEDANPILKSVHSSMKVNETEYQPTSSYVKFGEDSNSVGYVIEEYCLDEQADEGSQYSLNLGGDEVAFSMVPIESFESVDEALSGCYVCRNVGITIVCDAELREDGCLYADFYVLDSGKYAGVSSLRPGVWSDDDVSDYDPCDYYPYAVVNGNKITGISDAAEVFDGQNGMPRRLVFEVGDSVDMSTLSIHLPSLLVTTEEEEELRVDNDFIFGADAKGVTEQSEDEVIEKRVAFDEWNMEYGSQHNPMVDELSEEDRNTLNKYAKQLEEEGLIVCEDYIDSSYQATDNKWHSRKELLASDDNNENGDGALFVYVSVLSGQQELEQVKEEWGPDVQIEETEYGFTATVETEIYKAVYEYHTEDQVLIERCKIFGSAVG